MCIAWGPPYLLGDKDYQLLPCFMTLHKEREHHSFLELLYNHKHKRGGQLLDFLSLV
jgi:hypothetical protein